MIDTPTARISVSICYDAEFLEAARFLGNRGLKIFSVPFCTGNWQGYLKVRICARARAIENPIYVALASDVGNLSNVPHINIHYGQAAV